MLAQHFIHPGRLAQPRVRALYPLAQLARVVAVDAALSQVALAVALAVLEQQEIADAPKREADGRFLFAGQQGALEEVA